MSQACHSSIRHPRSLLLKELRRSAKPRSLFLGVLMLVAKELHLWLCSKENDLIQNFQKVKFYGTSPNGWMDQFAEAWCRGTSINNIVSGFHVTRIYLFCPNAILSKFQEQKEVLCHLPSKNLPTVLIFSLLKIMM